MNKIFILVLSVLLLPFCSALTSGEGTILLGALFSMSVIVIFFLVLSVIAQGPPMKVFFMALSLLTVLASVGMGVSIMQEFFSDLTNIVSAYGSFYILLVALTAAGIMGLIVWLVVVAVKSFYSYRGINKDDDLE